LLPRSVSNTTSYSRRISVAPPLHRVQKMWPRAGGEVARPVPSP
jgi:hypothetical protein